MNCPKCGKELLNVNGKYVCVNCGIEVPESQPGAPVAAGEPKPEPTATNSTMTTPEPSSMPMPDTQPSPTVIESAQPPTTENIPEASALEAQAPGQKISTEPVTESKPAEMTPESANNITISVETPPENIPAASPSTPSVPTPEASTLPNSIPTPETPPADPFDAIDNSLNGPEINPVNQEASIMTTEPSTPTQPVQADPTIFQNPIYDNNQPGPVDEPIPQPTGIETEEKSKKKITIILIAGIVVAVLLAIIGIIAYNILT